MTFLHSLQRKNATGKHLSKVAATFDCLGWKYKFNDAEDALITDFEIEQAELACFAGITEQNVFCFYSYVPLRCIEAQRQNCMELLARINHGLPNGCFEFDFDKGEIRCKTASVFTDSELTPATIEQVVTTNILLVGKYWEAIQAVLLFQWDATKALMKTGDNESLPDFATYFENFTYRKCQRCGWAVSEKSTLTNCPKCSLAFARVEWGLGAQN